MSGDFQIEGVSEELCERFSKRDAQIDKAVAKLLAGKPELAGTNIKDLRERLATAERTRKQKDLSRDELQSLWDAQMSKAERDSLRQLSSRPEKNVAASECVGLADAVQWAEEHLFERKSVVLECQIWQQALERARGEDFSLAELKAFTRQRNYIRNEERPNEVTLREVLLREMEIVQTVSDDVNQQSLLSNMCSGVKTFPSDNSAASYVTINTQINLRSIGYGPSRKPRNFTRDQPGARPCGRRLMYSLM
jgi:hypothetical protein